MVQERLELETSRGSRPRSAHAPLMFSSRRRKGGGVASRYFLRQFNVLSRTGVFTLRTRRITTRGSLYGVSCLLFLPVSHVLISNSDPRMWLHSNNVAGLFRALWHARHSIAGRCSAARLGSSLW